MIPDEAVEAAMDVVLDGGLVLKRSLIYDLLAAAAPHLTAAANGVGWNDALQYVYEEGYITRPQLEALELSSPYRKTDDAG